MRNIWIAVCGTLLSGGWVLAQLPGPMEFAGNLMPYGSPPMQPWGNPVAVGVMPGMHSAADADSARSASASRFADLRRRGAKARRGGAVHGGTGKKPNRRSNGRPEAGFDITPGRCAHCG